MSVNVGTWDRVIRIVLAVILAFIAGSSSGVLAVVLWIVAAMLFVTALIARCGLYAVLGIRTCPRSGGQRN